MNDGPHQRESERAARRRRVLLSIGVPLGLLLLILAMTGVDFAGRPVAGTEGLIAQQQMLMSVLQGIFGLAVALSTIYYAMRTGDMVEAMQDAAASERTRQVEVAVGNLVGAALASATASGAIAGLMKPSWRWYLPGAARARERFSMVLMTEVVGRMSEALRWSEEAAYLARHLKEHCDLVATRVVELHDSAIRGSVVSTEDGLAAFDLTSTPFDVRSPGELVAANMSFEEARPAVRLYDSRRAIDVHACCESLGLIIPCHRPPEEGC